MTDFEIHRHLDRAALADIRALVEATTGIEGHAPIGEHKMAHLDIGAPDWDGILAYSHAEPHAGALIGYVHLRWNPDGVDPRLAVEMVVHPDHRDEGVQQALLEATRRLVARSGGGKMFLWVHRVEEPTETLAHDMGFVIQRELAFMSRPAQPAPEPLEPPANVTIRTYRGPEDDEAFLEVNNAAFPDHPENGGWTTQDITMRRQLEWFDPDGLFLAFSGDRPLGLHWTKWHAHDAGEGDVPHGPLGEVYVLAIHPDAHGMGLGRSLLRHGMRHLAAKSDRIVLYVDRASGPAVKLYESEGFATEYLEVCFSDDIPAARHVSRALLRPA